MKFGTDGAVYFNMAADGLRQLVMSGVDTAGAGFRMLMTQNNPTG
jgi:hypothetical protein